MTPKQKAAFMKKQEDQKSGKINNVFKNKKAHDDC